MTGNEFKVGDRIVITTESCNYCYKAGDEAVLTGMDSDGDWWADFTCNKSFCYDGHWCLDEREFSLVDKMNR